MAVTRELVREGEWTRDGRMLTAGNTTWRDQIPLLARKSEDKFDPGHLIGVIHNIRREDNRIVGDLSIDIEDNLIVTCEVDKIGGVIKRAEGHEFTSARIVGCYVNKPENYPWADWP